MGWMITRIFIKAVLIVTLLMGLGSYAVYLKTGRFWVPEWNIQSLSMASFTGTFKQPVASMEPISKPTAPTYKWLKGGRWHYGDVPPPGVKARLISDSKK
jgi:hypothetical protein